MSPRTRVLALVASLMAVALIGDTATQFTNVMAEDEVSSSLDRSLAQRMWWKTRGRWAKRREKFESWFAEKSLQPIQITRRAAYNEWKIAEKAMQKLDHKMHNKKLKEKAADVLDAMSDDSTLLASPAPVPETLLASPAPMKGATTLLASPAPMKGATTLLASPAPVKGATTLLASPAPVKGATTLLASPAPVKGATTLLASPAPVKGATTLLASPAPVKGATSLLASPAPASSELENLANRLGEFASTFLGPLHELANLQPRAPEPEVVKEKAKHELEYEMRKNIKWRL